MSRTKRGQRRRALARWFDHRELLLVEAVLLLGLLEEVVQAWLLGQQGIPPLVRVLSGMALSLGWLGGVLLLVRRNLATGLKVTHAVVMNRIPIPVPQLVVHAAVMSSIVLAYAWFWDDATGALGEVARLASRVRSGVAAAMAAP